MRYELSSVGMRKKKISIDYSSLRTNTRISLVFRSRRTRVKSGGEKKEMTRKKMLIKLADYRALEFQQATKFSQNTNTFICSKN